MAEGTGTQPVPFWPPRVLNLSIGHDTNGQGYALKHAFDRYSTWSYRLLSTGDAYMAYPKDLRDPALIEDLWARADVIHTRNGLRAHMDRQRRMPRGIVQHHHGTSFRAAPHDYLRQAREMGAITVVSTIDLLVLAEHNGGTVEWLPAPHDIATIAALREHRPKAPKVVRISHAPTNRKLKGTRQIVEAVEAVAARHPIEFDLIEETTWADCLARKARSDIFIDQVILGYGSNAVEAWCMGLPVIAAVEDPEVRERMVALWGGLPFYDAGAGLEAAIEHLVVDAAARAEWGGIGLAHAQSYHDDQKVVAQLEALYLRCLGTVRSPRIEGLTSAGQTHPIFRRSAAA